MTTYRYPSADLTCPEYGLLGRTLGHSWSKDIHERFGNTGYSYLECEPEHVDALIQTLPWKGLNVTIPYKKQAYQRADTASDVTTQLQAANVLYRKDGLICADNTDVWGFELLLDRLAKRMHTTKESLLTDQPLAILGTGGAAAAVELVLRRYSSRVLCISRTYQPTYDDLYTFPETFALIVNATPVGMYPHLEATPLDFDRLQHLPHAVADLIYNPVRTKFCLDAEIRDIPTEQGLSMLVGQAAKAHELFFSEPIPSDTVDTVIAALQAQRESILFIGMPGSGKTTRARRLAEALKLEHIDTDAEIAQRFNLTPAELITTYGEKYFRMLEHEVVADICSTSRARVISCGGGVVVHPANQLFLKAQSHVIYLKRDPQELITKNRPLSQTVGREALYAARKALYESWADEIFEATHDISEDVNNLLRSTYDRLRHH